MRNELLANQNFDEILFKGERGTKGQTSAKIKLKMLIKS